MGAAPDDDAALAGIVDAQHYLDQMAAIVVLLHVLSGQHGDDPAVPGATGFFVELAQQMRVCAGAFHHRVQ